MNLLLKGNSELSRTPAMDRMADELDRADPDCRDYQGIQGVHMFESIYPVIAVTRAKLLEGRKAVTLQRNIHTLYMVTAMMLMNIALDSDIG